jgi:hypothetical protein
MKCFFSVAFADGLAVERVPAAQSQRIGLRLRGGSGEGSPYVLLLKLNQRKTEDWREIGTTSKFGQEWKGRQMRL